MQGAQNKAPYYSNGGPGLLYSVNPGDFLLLEF